MVLPFIQVRMESVPPFRSLSRHSSSKHEPVWLPPLPCWMPPPVQVTATGPEQCHFRAFIFGSWSFSVDSLQRSYSCTFKNVRSCSSATKNHRLDFLQRWVGGNTRPSSCSRCYMLRSYILRSRWIWHDPPLQSFFSVLFPFTFNSPAASTPCRFPCANHSTLSSHLYFLSPFLKPFPQLCGPLLRLTFSQISVQMSISALPSCYTSITALLFLDSTGNCLKLCFLPIMYMYILPPFLEYEL